MRQQRPVLGGGNPWGADGFWFSRGRPGVAANNKKTRKRKRKLGKAADRRPPMRSSWDLIPKGKRTNNNNNLEPGSDQASTSINHFYT